MNLFFLYNRSYCTVVLLSYLYIFPVHAAMLYIDINCYVSEFLPVQLPYYVRCLSVIKNNLISEVLVQWCEKDFLIVIMCIYCKYRVIHKSLRDFRTRLRNNQDSHGRKEHISR